MRTSEQVNELQDALSKAQAEIEPAVRGAENKHLGNRFADYASCWEAIRKPLSANGLSISQGTGYIDERLMMITRLGHSSGQWMETDTPVILEEMKGLKKMQALGVAHKYAQRYGLRAIVGLPDEDETDGEVTAPGKATAPRQQNDGLISEKQVKRFWALHKKSGLTNKQAGLLLKGHGVPVQESLEKMVQSIPWNKYEAICDELEAEDRSNETARVVREEASIEDTY